MGTVSVAQRAVKSRLNYHDNLSLIKIDVKPTSLRSLEFSVIFIAMGEQTPGTSLEQSRWLFQDAIALRFGRDK